MEEHDFEYLRDVLDDIRYWDTCPDDYKQRFEILIKQIDEHRKSLVTLGLPSVTYCGCEWKDRDLDKTAYLVCEKCYKPL